MDKKFTQPRWLPIGQYRTFPLPILPILPPMKPKKKNPASSKEILSPRQEDKVGEIL